MARFRGRDRPRLQAVVRQLYDDRETLLRNEFRALNLGRIKAALRSPVIVDLRNVYDRVRMRGEGFQYFSVGRADDMRRKKRH